MNKIERHKIERYSCDDRESGKGFCALKRCQYKVNKEKTLTGDAPKAFISVYEYEKGAPLKRKRESKWKKYIAKTGHKWYPIESITEYLMNCFGEVFGLEMSKSKLYIINGQLRFLSEYFLDDKREELIHGAEIFGGYLEDMDFVEEVEEKKMSRDLFTMQFVSKSVNVRFGEDEGSKIMHELVKLMLFDALIGVKVHKVVVRHLP